MNTRPVAVITGASRGIGRAIAVSLASEGFDIAAIARTVDSEGMESLHNEISARTVEFFPVGLDISCTACHTEVIKNILERYGRIDLLVNNAGVAPLKRNDLLDMTEESYERVMNINLKGPVFFAQKIAKEMMYLRQQINEFNPVIIFISSISSTRTSVNRAEYCISKAGLSMAASVFADRLSGENIRVFDVRTGIIKTEMTAKVKDTDDNLIEVGMVPQKRWGYPEDVGKAVVSLARGDWDFSTGAIFDVSGGLNISRL